MKRVAAGAHLPTHWLFERAKRRMSRLLPGLQGPLGRESYALPLRHTGLATFNSRANFTNELTNLEVHCDSND